MESTETEKFKLAIGRELQRIREKRGWTQRELADFAGVPQPTISALERGFRMPGLDTFLRITEALGTSPDNVLRGAGILPEEGSESEPGFWELWGLMRRLRPETREEIIRFVLFREREQKK